MANFLDFVNAAISSDKAMGKEFLEQVKNSDAEQLSQWFDSKGYEVPVDECTKIIKNRSAYENEQLMIEATY